MFNFEDLWRGFPVTMTSKSVIAHAPFDIQQPAGLVKVTWSGTTCAWSDQAPQLFSFNNWIFLFPWHPRAQMRMRRLTSWMMVLKQVHMYNMRMIRSSAVTVLFNIGVFRLPWHPVRKNVCAVWLPDRRRYGILMRMICSCANCTCSNLEARCAHDMLIQCKRVTYLMRTICSISASMWIIDHDVRTSCSNGETEQKIGHRSDFSTLFRKFRNFTKFTDFSTLSENFKISPNFQIFRPFSEIF